MEVQIDDKSLEKNLMDENTLWNWFNELLKDNATKMNGNDYGKGSIKAVTKILAEKITELQFLLYNRNDGVTACISMADSVCANRWKGSNIEVCKVFGLEVAGKICGCVATLYCNHKWLAGSASWENKKWRDVMEGQYTADLESKTPIIPNALDISTWLLQLFNTAISQPRNTQKVTKIKNKIETLRNSIKTRIDKLCRCYKSASGVAKNLSD